MASYDSKAGGDGSNASQNNLRNAGKAPDAILDMISDIGSTFKGDATAAGNAVEALQDIMSYVRTGRSDIDFDGAIGSMTKEQQAEFMRGMSGDLRSADDNVKKAKQVLKKIKPNAGEVKRQEQKPKTAEQKRIAEAVARENQADRLARQVEQRYGKDAKARTRNAKSLASIKNSDIDKMNKSQLKSAARKASVFSVGKYLGAPKTEAEALRRADALLSGASITDLKNAIKRGRKYAKDFIEE